MKRKISIIMTLLLLASYTATAQDQTAYADLEKGEAINLPGIYAKIETSEGFVVFYLDYKNTPLTTTNFINLAESGFYKGLKFYRDIENYALFCGDPLNNGTSDAGYNFPMEINEQLSHNQSGILSMDGISTLSNGSRFFISKSADPILDSKYSAFGFIVEGDKVLKKLTRKDSIISIEIIRTGPGATSFLSDEAEFNRLSSVMLSRELESFRVTNPDVVTAIETLGENVKKTLTGIYYKISEKGSGEKAVKGDFVSVNYTGKLIDGTIFDSSISRGTPFEFSVGKRSVIYGMDETLLDMSIGEKRTVIIPPELAYGENQNGPIPPNSWLIFELEFLGIN